MATTATIEEMPAPATAISAAGEPLGRLRRRKPSEVFERLRNIVQFLPRKESLLIWVVECVGTLRLFQDVK